MSHEANAGKIAPEQVEHLQTRRMDEREAISLIVRGFLGAELFGLGPELDTRIGELAELAGHGEKDISTASLNEGNDNESYGHTRA